MNEVKVSFTCRVPVAATYDEILDWLKFKLGEAPGVEAGHYMADQDLEAREVQILYVADGRL